MNLDNVALAGMTLCAARNDSSVSGAAFVQMIADLVGLAVREALAAEPLPHVRATPAVVVPEGVAAAIASNTDVVRARSLCSSCGAVGDRHATWCGTVPDAPPPRTVTHVVVAPPTMSPEKVREIVDRLESKEPPEPITAETRAAFKKMAGAEPAENAESSESAKPAESADPPPTNGKRGGQRKLSDETVAALNREYLEVRDANGGKTPPGWAKAKAEEIGVSLPTLYSAIAAAMTQLMTDKAASDSKALNRLKPAPARVERYKVRSIEGTRY